MASKRRFGRVRRLPSGRWQARYKGPEGIDRPAPRTFAFKTDAERWLALMEAEIVRGDWIDPDAGRVTFGKYAETWIEERPGLRAKTVELYRYLLRRHLAPTFGPLALADISEQRVRRVAQKPPRRWHQLHHCREGVPAAQGGAQHRGR